MPVEALPPTTPFTDHVTALFGVFRTVAVNCCFPPSSSVTAVGERLMVTGSQITDALPIAVLSAWEVAAITLVAGPEMTVGAE